VDFVVTIAADEVLVSATTAPFTVTIAEEAVTIEVGTYSNADVLALLRAGVGAGVAVLVDDELHGVAPEPDGAVLAVVEGAWTPVAPFGAGDAVDAIEAIGDGALVTAAGVLGVVVPGAEGHLLGVSGGAWAAVAPPTPYTDGDVSDHLLSILTASGDYLYRTAAGALAASHQGTVALGAYEIDWSAGDRFTKTLSGGDVFTHVNTEAKSAIRLVLTVNGQALPSGLGTMIGGQEWNAAWTTAYVWIAKDGAGGYEYTLAGA
jgi:hypothetical protein